MHTDNTNTIKNTNPKIENVIEELKKVTFHINTLDKYPSKPSSPQDTKSKGAIFTQDRLNGEGNGLYMAFDRPDLTNKNTQKFLSKNEFLNDMETLLLTCLYSGEGSMLDRVSKMRARVGAQEVNPVAFYLNDNPQLSREDIVVVVFSLGLDGPGRKEKFERPIHNFTEEKTGKKFRLADYSASNGENGQTEYFLQNTIMGFGNLDFHDGTKQIAKTYEILKSASAVLMANNSSMIASGDLFQQPVTTQTTV